MEGYWTCKTIEGTCLVCNSSVNLADFAAALDRKAPVHPQPWEQGRETGDRSGEIGASRSERAARVSDTAVWWREAC
jgi:hypothetical protein